MKMLKRCECCIWFDKCRADEVCDDYTPSDIEEQEAVEYYRDDLRIRHEIYEDQIQEQNA